MPYIGNNHIAGDHTNNFKVLDDISSFTATFDGSASSVVDTTNDTIRVVEHRFIQGQRVTYTNGSGGNIGGLTTGTAYFVIFDSASTIKLATNASNAANSTAINLSAVGTGSSHTLNAAFDGVNTKFKITYNGGTGARFNNATQLNIAINNVLQKPNVNSSTFTEGFAIEDNHKIVFKNAPTNQDIFWGSIIANTLTTFDISDHKIDTFTGDGSTTEFTLSHTPANNESLMVTINGVLQHPSNASTARAYTLIASIIQFTAAPGVGDEIQVRHLGFAGATTADVSGFYGRTGNVALTTNDHITVGDIPTVRNINASGIITASQFVGNLNPNIGGSNANFTGIVTAGVFKGGDFDGRNLNISGIATFAGDVSIGGTLTYEDVTNIDSVGIITARDGLKVLTGGANVVGLVTVTNSASGIGLKLIDASSKQFFAGGGGGGTPFAGSFTGHDFRIQVGGLQNAIFKYASGAKGNLELGPSSGIGITFNGSTGNAGYAGIITATGADINGDLDVDGHTNLDNVSIAGVSTLGTGGSGQVTLQYQGNQKLKTHTWGVEVSGALSANNIVATAANSSFAGASFTGAIDANGDLDVDGHTNLDNVSIAGIVTVTGELSVTDDIIAGDEIRNNVATDFWASDNTFINLNGFGNLTHMGGFETNLTSNGYRDTNGQWVGYNAGSNGGAAQIGLKPQGSIVFRTDASKANGSAHNPSTRLTIDDEGIRPQGGVLNLKNSGSTGNITVNVLGVSGDSRIDLENTGNGNYSGIDFVRERSSGTGVVGGSIFMKSDTSSNNALMYIQAQSASAQSPVTSALGAGNGVRLKLQGGQGIFAVETGADERLRIESDGQVVINRPSGAVLADSSSKLEVFNSTENLIFVANSTAAASQDAGIIFAPANNVYGGKIIVTSDEDFSTSANRSAHMAFYTRKDGTADERLRITSGGNVQLNTDGQQLTFGSSQKMKFYYESSEDRMYLQGDGAYGFAFRVNGGNRLEISKTTGDVNMQGASGRNFQWDNSEASLYLTDSGSSSARLKIGTGGDLQMYHDTSGNLNHITAATNGTIKISGGVEFWDYTGVTKRAVIDSNGLRTGGVAAPTLPTTGVTPMIMRSATHFTKEIHRTISDYRNICDGVHSGYLLLIPAYPGSGTVSGKKFYGTITCDRGSTGSGNSTQVATVHAATGYSDDQFYVENARNSQYLTHPAKVTYNGTQYLALKFSHTGGGPNYGIHIDGHHRGTDSNFLRLVRQNEIDSVQNDNHGAIANHNAQYPICGVMVTDMNGTPLNDNSIRYMRGGTIHFEYSPAGTDCYDNGIFTAHVNGIYHVTAGVLTGNNVNRVEFAIQRQVSGGSYQNVVNFNGAGNFSNSHNGPTATAFIKMKAGWKLRVYRVSSNQGAYGSTHGNNYFGAVLMHGLMDSQV